MSDLRTAAIRLLEAYDAHDPLAVVMEDLRAALVEDAMQKFTDVNQELEAALAAPIIQPEIKDDNEPRLLPWKGLTEEEHTYYKACGFVGVKAVEEKLRARNSTLVSE